jgi:hypothetical protein
MIGPHPHDVVAITIRIVRIAIGQAYPKRDEVPEVMVMVVVVEAPTGHSGEACSARHGSNPGCTKSAGGWATRGEAAAVKGTRTAMETATAAAVETATAAAVETATAAAMESATAAAVKTSTAAAVAAATATRRSIHRHRRNADCGNCRKSEQHFPEHGTLLLQVRPPTIGNPIRRR